MFQWPCTLCNVWPAIYGLISDFLIAQVRLIVWSNPKYACNCIHTNSFLPCHLSSASLFQCMYHWFLPLWKHFSVSLISRDAEVLENLHNLLLTDSSKLFYVFLKLGSQGEPILVNWIEVIRAPSTTRPIQAYSSPSVQICCLRNFSAMYAHGHGDLCAQRWLGLRVSEPSATLRHTSWSCPVMIGSWKTIAAPPL